MSDKVLEFMIKYQVASIDESKPLDFIDPNKFPVIEDLYKLKKY